MNATKVFINNEQEMLHFAANVAKYAFKDMIILLDGELGVGKTTFTKGFAKGLGVNAIIKSPTYTFVREYHQGLLPMFHMDTYRLEDIGPDGIGLEEYFEMGGVTLIEWSQFISDILPNHYLMIHFFRDNANEVGRYLVIESHGEMYEEIVKNIANDMS